MSTFPGIKGKGVGLEPCETIKIGESVYLLFSLRILAIGEMSAILSALFLRLKSIFCCILCSPSIICEFIRLNSWVISAPRATTSGVKTRDFFFCKKTLVDLFVNFVYCKSLLIGPSTNLTGGFTFLF